MKSRMDKLELIKNNIDLHKYTDPEILKKDIDGLIDEFWNNENYICNEHLFDMDLDEFSDFHLKLIDRVEKIHELESNIYTRQIIKNHTDMKYIASEVKDSSRAYKIYCFKENRDYIFVGDLHSDDQSLARVFKDSDFYSRFLSNDDFILIFNGDYVDRGQNHLKIMERILIMKYLFKDNIFMLRGNHDGGKILEDGSIKLPYGIPESHDNNMYFPKYLENLIEKNKSFDSGLLKAYLDFFDSLSYIAIVNIENQTIMAVHGGVARPDIKAKEYGHYYDYIDSISYLTEEDILDEFGRSPAQNIMWSDPYRDGEYKENTGRFHFKQEHVDSFMKRFNLDFIIRGHEEAREGYWYALDEKVITIFASGSLDDDKNETDNTESWYKKVTPKILKINYRGDRSFL